MFSVISALARCYKGLKKTTPGSLEIDFPGWFYAFYEADTQADEFISLSASA